MWLQKYNKIILMPLDAVDRAFTLGNYFQFPSITRWNISCEEGDSAYRNYKKKKKITRGGKIDICQVSALQTL